MKHRRTPTYRSAEWFGGSDEVALLHRAAMRSTGHRVDPDDGRPIVAITTSQTDLNPCNTVLAARIEQIAAGVTLAGGIAVTVPTMSLGEDLMKPSAMLYRNLLAVEVEEYLRSYPIDAVVVTGNCDKSVPGAVMGALSADLPMITHVGGARAAACLAGRPLGTSDVWRLWQEHQAGRLSAVEWQAAEEAFGGSAGACNVMGTASTMAIMVETLGLVLSGTALIPAGDAAGLEAAHATGERVVELARAAVRPSAVLSAGSFRNAAVVLAATGGSTNAVIHLLALAGRAGVRLTLDDVHDAGRGVAVVTDVQPSGAELIHALHRAGGVPAVLRVLADHLDTGARTVGGQTVGEIIATAPTPGGCVRTLDDPVVGQPAIDVLHGSLAPDGAVIKRSAASPRLFRHRGPAVVFEDYHDMRHRIDDPDLDVTADSVLVMRGCGPVGGPGMPEWGMVPIPAKLSRAGVTDMVRLTDARMSGTSFGTVVLHAAPEAAVGGPIAHVRTGDPVQLDVEARRIDLDIDPAELAGRARSWRPGSTEHVRGWPALYRAHVQQASHGCDLDFLTLAAGTRPHLVPPTIGRS